MSKATFNICFKAKVLRPAQRPKGSSWTFLILPRSASAKPPTRGVTTVQGIINGHPFRAGLQPDGQKSHWLKMNKKMRQASRAEVGEVILVEITSVATEPEPRVPLDLRQALAAADAARAVWSDITCVARRDWIVWITSARRSETRARRVSNACEMLAAGKRRVCCVDRSGSYSEGFSAPKAAD